LHRALIDERQANAEAIRQKNTDLNL